jgi:tRNA isopentenyl-2-thiomethyl-A-37 hydroxylase MiaE
MQRLMSFETLLIKKKCEHFQCLHGLMEKRDIKNGLLACQIAENGMRTTDTNESLFSTSFLGSLILEGL